MKKPSFDLEYRKFLKMDNQRMNHRNGRVKYSLNPIGDWTALGLRMDLLYAKSNLRAKLIYDFYENLIKESETMTIKAAEHPASCKCDKQNDLSKMVPELIQIPQYVLNAISEEAKSNNISYEEYLRYFLAYVLIYDFNEISVGVRDFISRKKALKSCFVKKGDKCEK